MASSTAYLDSLSSRRVFVHEPDIRALSDMEEVLRPSYSLQMFDQASSLLDAFSNMRPPDLTLMPWTTPRQSASMLEQVVAACAGSPILLLSNAPEGEDMAFAMRLGATGFLQKPFHKRALGDAIEQQFALVQVQALNSGMGDLAVPLGDGSFFVRSSRVMHEIAAQAALIAHSDIPVLILGESGTGKEVLARYTHVVSDRSKNMFLKVNCAAMPTDLLESELFGHEKGAFTGATHSKRGKFEICDGGTIFLDEIGEMSGALQAKLLHVLQDGMYSRLGSHTMMKADVRVIAATNVDMKSALANKSFREDLYYRLNGLSLTLPPLRERREEIATFADHFMQKAARKFRRKPAAISNALRAALMSYSWPGNLRELENLINRYLIIGNERSILAVLASDAEPATGPSPTIDRRVSHPRAGRRASDRSIEKTPGRRVSDQYAELPTAGGLRQHVRKLTDNAESAAIASALDQTKWNRRAAARNLDMSYTALRYKIKQYKLESRGTGSSTRDCD